MTRFEHGAYRFCAAPGCPVVYFNDRGRVFDVTEVRVPVWQKLPAGSRMICYCFGENERTIRSEVEAHGRSAAVDRIRAHIAARRCACEIRNPRGTCCLGDVAEAVARINEDAGDAQDRTTG